MPVGRATRAGLVRRVGVASRRSNAALLPRDRGRTCCAVVPDALNTVHAIRGQNVQLPCRTSPGHNVTWIQIEKTDRPFFRMYFRGQVYDWLQYRINISDARTGDFGLNIYNIQVTDAGRYFCIAGFYEQPQIVLSPSTYPESLGIYDVYVEGQD